MALDRILVVGKGSKTQQIARPFTKSLFAADEPEDIWELINAVQPEMIIFDEEIPHYQTHDFIETLNDRSMDIPVIVIGGEDKDQDRTELLEAGAYDYILGENDMQRMGQIVDSINEPDTNSERNAFFSEDCPSSVSIVGKSPAMAKSLKMIRTVAQSSCNPVLIVGETGTGKELAARAVHILRHGSESKFVAVNCAALTANLLESELFGHVKGSFTSADREKVGLLEAAGQGTIFLDEISELPLDLQAKLLRVLQEKTFRKVGGLNDIECNATIVASSNRKLLETVEEGKFRRDLYYRLSICPITLAPLRSASRKQDITLLADYFIKNSTICPEKTGKIKGMTKMAIDALTTHHWPGNVRELQNVIDRAIMLESSDRIGLQNIIIHPEQAMEDDAEEQTNSFIKDFSLQRAEKELIAKALTEAGWQKTRAAALLGITRATLYAKVKQYDIQQSSQNQPAMSA